MSAPPAFPTLKFYDERPIDVIDGMTLRDYFAAAALPGAIAAQGASPSDYADQAYRIADAMLAARRATL